MSRTVLTLAAPKSSQNSNRLERSVGHQGTRKKGRFNDASQHFLGGENRLSSTHRSARTGTQATTLTVSGDARRSAGRAIVKPCETERLNGSAFPASVEVEIKARSLERFAAIPENTGFLDVC
jgi:hypothetical protein